VSPGELKAAVSKAGPMVEDVARELGKSGDDFGIDRSRT
jgi:Protein of unknown function (DUF3606)